MFFIKIVEIVLMFSTHNHTKYFKYLTSSCLEMAEKVFTDKWYIFLSINLLY